MEMRKHKRLVALLVTTCFAAWFQGSAQQNPYENLPNGFPIGDVNYIGDNSYSSLTFGDFQLDPNIHNRVIHNVLGPFVWEWNENTKVVTLRSEWWGPLYTCVPSNEDTAEVKFPYVRSEYTGAIYLVDPTGSTGTPFYNHNKDANNNDVGWQSGIGLNLNDAHSNYIAAETMVRQMQEQLHAMRVARDQLSGATVAIGNTNLEQYRQQVIDHFQVVNDLYGRFLFYRLRLILAPQWVRTMGGEDGDISAAQEWVSHIPALEQVSAEVFQEGQQTLFDQTENIFATKVQERAQLEQAQQQPQQPHEPTTPGLNPEGGPTAKQLPGAGSSWENPLIVGPVAWDAFSWPVTIELPKVTIANGNIYFNCKKDYWVEEDHSSPTKPNNWLVGNFWVIQKVGDKYYSTNIDYFKEKAMYKLYPAVMTHGLGYIWNMSYKPGEQYGAMVTTTARRTFRTTDERSNIVFFTAL